MKNQLFPYLSISLLLLFFCTNLALGQEEKLISSKKLLKDFEIMENIISAHPDPYTHISESVMSARLEELKTSLDHPHTQLAFYKKIASLIALIEDGHSSARLPKFWMQKKRKEFGCFPYEMHLTNENELYVLKSFNNGKIKPGSRIVSINGITVDSFLNVIDPYISYEKLKFRNTIIDNNFEKFLYLAFDQSKDLTFKHAIKDTLESVVENMPLNEWKKFQNNEIEERESLMIQGKPYAYEKIKDGVGMISIYGFYAQDINAYSLFLSKTFKTIRRDSIHSLIIDIRGNYAGWPKISSKLFHYIHDGHFKTMAKSSMKVSEPYRNYFYERFPLLKSSKHIISFQKSLHSIDIDAVLNNEIGSYVDQIENFNEKPFTEEFEFIGDVYLMTNRDSYSAASSFASTFQCYNMGLIIGEETGGTKIFRATAMQSKLGSSGVGIRMSTSKNYTACYNEEGEGITPNIEYIPSIFELMSDLDTQLIYVQHLIRKTRKKREALKTAGAKSTP